jgi:rod shape-determining protein MreB
MKKVHNLSIGERTAEEIKIRLGSAYPIAEELKMEVRGLNQVSGLPRTVTITSGEIREALLEPVNTIVEAVRDTLEKCPPELAADIIDRGIVLAGGGALLQGLDELISHDTEVPVHIADDPLSCVVLGTGKVLEDFATLKRVLGTGVEQ